MAELKGSQTEKNLMTAFAGESQARNKYTYFASKAKKEGYVQISKIFEETAANEKEHAEIWYKLLHGGAVPDTVANLPDKNNVGSIELTFFLIRWLQYGECAFVRWLLPLVYASSEIDSGVKPRLSPSAFFNRVGAE